MFPHTEKEILHEAGGIYAPVEIEGLAVTVRVILENPTVTYLVTLKKDPVHPNFGWCKEEIKIA